MAQQYTVKQIETLGAKCKFDSMGAQRDGWIMPNGFGVDYAGYGQLTFEPESIATTDQVGLMRSRVAVASNMLKVHYAVQPISEVEIRLEADDAMLLVCIVIEGGRSVTQLFTIKFKPGAASWVTASLLNLTDALDTDEEWTPSFSQWRHGGWYITNVRYPNGAIGCVSNNYADSKWRVVCDSRRVGLDVPGDFSFNTREEAAMAERELVRIEAQAIQAKLASNPATDRISLSSVANIAAA